MRVKYEKDTGYSISDKVRGEIKTRIAELNKTKKELITKKAEILNKRINRGDRLVEPVVVPNYTDPSKPYI